MAGAAEGDGSVAVGRGGSPEENTFDDLPSVGGRLLSLRLGRRRLTTAGAPVTGYLRGEMGRNILSAQRDVLPYPLLRSQLPRSLTRPYLPRARRGPRRCRRRYLRPRRRHLPAPPLPPLSRDLQRRARDGEGAEPTVGGGRSQETTPAPDSVPRPDARSWPRLRHPAPPPTPAPSPAT